MDASFHLQVESPMSKTKKISYSAIIGAAYAMLTILLAPISYGVIQIRVSEALCILPFFLPESAIGLFVGCIIANITTGNVFDIVFGSIATLVAAYLTSKSKKIWVACIWPIVVNAIIIGIVISYAYLNTVEINVLLLSMLQIGVSEGVVMLLLAVPLAKFIQSKKGDLFK